MRFMSSEKEELLKQSIALLIESSGLSAGEIGYEELHEGRHCWTRNLETNFRYMRVMALDEAEFPGDYTILWGCYPRRDRSAYCDEFDAQSYGDLEYVLAFFKSWLIDLKEWHEPLEVSPSKK